MSLVNGLKLKIQFYEIMDEGIEDKPLFIELETSGCGRFVGSDEQIKTMVKEANEEYELFRRDSHAFADWIMGRVNFYLEFYSRPGGLFSRIPEEERPNLEDIKSWGWRVDKLESVTTTV